MMSASLPSRLLAALVLACACAGPARAADKDHVDAAKKFLTDKDRAKAVLFFMHPTADFKSVKLVEQTGVINALTKEERKGWFCLKMRYSWRSNLFNDDHTTDLLVFFNDKGKLDSLRAGTTSTFAKPFGAANVVLAAVKEKLLEDIKDDDVRKVVAAFIRNEDVAGLLGYLLKLDQK